MLLNKEFSSQCQTLVSREGMPWVGWGVGDGVGGRPGGLQLHFIDTS